MAAAMPGTVLVGWLATAVAGIASDVAFDRMGDVGNLVLIIYGILITFVQVWITREAFKQVGIAPALLVGNSLSVYLQGVLIGLGILLGIVLVILPGLYVFARWYLASALLVRYGSGRRAAMQRSWDMLAAHWPAALGVGLILAALSVAPLVVGEVAPALAVEYGFGWLAATNLVAAAGIVGGYLAAVSLLLNIEQPAPALQEIFG
ncbi:hypothetical protein [Sphingopyxis sp.]|uniref:hypothetical protein n=1 Tax=Sphingopyxis sp. TaxID=1908224 RepID=UPI0025CE9CEA|nr:hypothetical protein [Sphingopyxis sp.]MBK6414424.1 hypothetical protein [Sphingopyxis sp.]